MELELPPGCAATYAVERQLASGGFGTVYLARHRALDRPVALKLLKPEVLADPEAVDRFVNEARITASLQHPHIVVLLDHGIEDGVPWIAYEYLPATSLRTRMGGAPMSWREALAVGAQVGSALAAAHAAGVLHRDIKPENVLLMDDDNVKVADFGTAKWSSGRTVTTGDGVILGTPAYLAPELVAGVAATPQSDVYALGAMLYELICGAVPFDGGTVAASLRDRLEYEPLSLAARCGGVPPQVDAVVLKAIARSRSERFMTAQALHVALTALLDESPPGALAAFRRAAHASVVGGEPANSPTVRTVVMPAPPRRTVTAPALELKARGRALMALSLATGVLGALAVLTRPPAMPALEPPEAPRPASSAAAHAEVADQQLLRLWTRLRERDPRERALWTFLTDPTQREPPPTAASAQALFEELDRDLAAVDRVAKGLTAHALPTVRLTSLRARATALAFQLTCRRDNCEIAWKLPRGVADWDTAVKGTPQHFGSKASALLTSWLDDLVLALTEACAANALDRRLALLLDETWQTACYVNHELEHFDRTEVAAAMERASRRLKALPHDPLATLSRLMLSAWSLPAQSRRARLESARVIAIQLLPRSRDLGDALCALIAARVAPPR